MKTVKEVAEKYGMKIAKDAVLEDLILELMIRVKNLEQDVEVLTRGDYHDDIHRSYGEALMRKIKESN